MLLLFHSTEELNNIVIANFSKIKSITKNAKKTLTAILRIMGDMYVVVNVVTSSCE